jgi:hypothetical protein
MEKLGRSGMEKGRLLRVQKQGLRGVKKRGL